MHIPLVLKYSSSTPSMGKGFVMLTIQRYRNPYTAMLVLAACLPLQAIATEIATNMRLSFNEIAILNRTTTVTEDGVDITAYSDHIDKLLTLDPTKANARFLSSRLGTFTSGNLSIDLRGNQFISLNEPGVSTLPATQRPLTRIEAGATLSGGLLNAPGSLNLDVTWVCPATFLQCTADGVYSPLKTLPALSNTSTNAAALVQPIRLQASGATTFTTDGVSVNYAGLSLSGTLNVNATFTAKTPSQYVADALSATAGTAGGHGAARWGAAAADIQSLRDAVWTDVPVANNLKVSRTPELESAQGYLATARDSAALLATGNTTGNAFNSPFALTRQLWDVAATANPSLGRDRAGFTSENVPGGDVPSQIAIMRMMANGTNDADFVTGLQNALTTPLSTGPDAALTLDGALIGLADATISVYYLGNIESGQVEINLAGADHYALWRTGFDRISLLEGADAGLTVLGSDGLSGTPIRKQDGEVYVGETFGGLLYLSGQSTNSRLQLNNFYSDQLLVVASWAVTPVPEPSQAWLFMMGVPLMLWRKKFS